MQERKEEAILSNFKQAKSLMVQAAQEYLKNNCPVGDRYGDVHGQSGRNRASNLIKCLEAIADDNHNAILALLLAIYGKPSAGYCGIAFGRSSGLASMIADAFIQGTCTRRTTISPLIGNLTSAIFSQSSLDKIKKKPDVMPHIPFNASLDKTKAVRFLIQEILNSPEFIRNKELIESAEKHLSSTLISSNQNIYMTCSDEFIKKTEEYKKSVAIAAFAKTNPRLPHLAPALGRTIASFFSIKDAGSLAGVSKINAAAATANLPNPVVTQIVKKN